MDETAESVAALDPAGHGSWWRVGWFESDIAVESPGVAVGGVLPSDVREVALAPDQARD